MAKILATCNGIGVKVGAGKDVKKWLDKTRIRMDELGVPLD